jgi:hypothetical protein
MKPQVAGPLIRTFFDRHQSAHCPQLFKGISTTVSTDNLGTVSLFKDTIIHYCQF